MISPKSTAPPSPFPGQLNLMELSAASGVDSDEISRYIEQGLLPPPTQTPGETVYYAESCVKLLELIQKFHRKYALPLSMIKQVIHEIGYDKAPLLSDELEEKLNQARQMPWLELPGDVDSEETRLTRKELLDATGISPNDLEEAIRQNFILPNEDDRFSQKDLDVAMLLSEVKKNQDKNSDILSVLLNMHLKTTEALVEEEFNFFLKNILNNNISVEDANELINKSYDLLADLFPKCYWQMLNRKIKKLLVEANNL